MLPIRSSARRKNDGIRAFGITLALHNVWTLIMTNVVLADGMDFSTVFGILHKEIIAYLCKYEDNRFIFRQLSRAFYYMPSYDRLVVNKQPPSFLTRFFTIHPVKSLRVRQHHRKLCRLPPTLFHGLEKIVVESMEARELYFFCKYFSQFPIVNLHIKYCTCRLPDTLLGFNELRTLDITITSKENEDTVFNLVRLNAHTLRKLKVGVYTGQNVDEERLARVIEENLSLEVLHIRGNIFTSKMITSRMRYLRSRILYKPDYVYNLRYLLTLNMHGIHNHDLVALFGALECVEWVSLSGKSCNIDSLRYSDDYKYKKLLWKPFAFEPDNYEPYDFTSVDLDVRSKNLRSFHLTAFTIRRFRLSRPEILKTMYFSDVQTLEPLFFPEMVELEVENFHLNPEAFVLDHFRLPRLRCLSMHKCLITQPFLFKSLRSLNIQNSVVMIDMLHTVRHHYGLRNILFFHNDWDDTFHPDQLKAYSHSRKIDVYDTKEW